jgi:hypothetical protein
MDIKKMLSLYSLIFITFVLMNCYMGPNVTRLKPELVVNKIGLVKQLVTEADTRDVKKQSLHTAESGNDKGVGYFKRNNKKVTIKIEGSYPKSYISCFDNDNHLLWVRSTELWPTNRINHVTVLERTDEIAIYILLDGDNSEYVAILDEDGNTRKIIPLHGTEERFFRGKRFHFLHIYPSVFGEKMYIMALGGEGVGIYSMEGQLVTFLNTPVYPTAAAGLEIKTSTKNYYVVYADNRATSRSSTLFVLSDKWDLLYNEILKGGEWLSKIDRSGQDEFLIGTIIGWKDVGEGRFIPEREIWRYSFH